MASGSGKTWWCRAAQVRGPLMVCPTTMMSTMKTASSTRIQHIATATIVCSAWRADRTRPSSSALLPHRDARRDEILIRRRPLASLDAQSYKSDLELANLFLSSLDSYCVNVMGFPMRTPNCHYFHFHQELIITYLEGTNMHLHKSS